MTTPSTRRRRRTGGASSWLFFSIVCLLPIVLDAQDYSVLPHNLTPEPSDGPDEWTSEAHAAEIEDRLGKLADLIKSGASEAGIREYLHPGFQATALQSQSTARVQSTGSLEVFRGVPDPEVGLDAASFPRELLALLGDRHPERVKFKLTGLRSLAQDKLETDILYYLTASGAAGGVLQRRGRWRTSWARAANQSWQLRQLEALPYSGGRTGRPVFTDITSQALGQNASYQRQLRHGIDYWRSNLDAVTSIAVTGHHGIAIADVDADGFEDFYVAQPSGLPNLLYRNNGDGTFTDITSASGLDVLDVTYSSLFLDVDNDNDPDLVLVGQDLLLFLNDATGKFRLSQKTGFSAVREARGSFMSAAAADYDRDGNIDLYLCAHSNSVWDGAGEDFSGLPYPFHDANNGAPNILLRNRGNGKFEDVTRTSGIDQNNRRFSFAAAWGDYNGDGHPDIYVANDFGRNNLYRNNGDGTFSDVAADAGVEDIGAGMSVAWEDYDNDGRLDLYVGNMWSSAGQRLTTQERFLESGLAPSAAQFQRHARGSSLFRNNGDGTFADVSIETGVELGRWAWSSDFFDFDNDGREDIYVANGFITGDDTGDL